MTWLTPTDIVVVTGGSKGLGASILREFAIKGCQTVSLDIAKKTLTSSFSKSLINGDGALDKSEEENEETHDDNPNNISDESSKSIPVNAIEENIPSAVGSEASTEPPQEETTGEVLNEEDLKPTLSIECDVRNVSDLEKARELIYATFNRHATVLVLNAAIRRPLNSIAESSYEDLQSTIDVNLNGVLKCLRTFLPDFISNERGFVVTIASALGIVVPKGLGSYGASKAALIGIHEALSQEIMDYKDLHTLLVCPGQLDTTMFSDVSTPSDLLAPVVATSKLAEKIVKRLIKGKTSTVYSPTYVRYLPLINAIPVSWARLARKLSGVDNVFDDIIAKRVEAEAQASGSSADDNSDIELSQEESDLLTSSESLHEPLKSQSSLCEKSTSLSSIENSDVKSLHPEVTTLPESSSMESTGNTAASNFNVGVK